MEHGNQKAVPISPFGSCLLYTSENFSYESSIDEQTYNKIKLAFNNEKTGKRELFIAQDGEKMNQWGVLQYFEEVQTKTGASAKANALLKLCLLYTSTALFMIPMRKAGWC